MQTLRENEPPSAADTLAPARPKHADTFTPEALPAGSRLDEFEIVRVLGAGGFGIVYLALDQVLLRYVAIKEFIPTALAGRTPEGAIVVRSPEAAETFEIGLDSFYNEGRLLARFDNPSLVRVFRFWKANGTAYMAMQYYPGQTLKEARRQMPAPPDEAWLRLFVDRLLGALETLHAQGVYHRDIAPDNILLLPDGQPVILDFGSARRVISDRTQSLTAILKPNYSPVEQYADDAGMRQGAYTDLYALGGTVYFMLTGKEPIPAVMRAVRDSFPVMARSEALAFAPMSHEFLAALDWALGVAPDERPQTVADLRAALCGETLPPPPAERSGVLIADPSQPYDAARAMAKTELAAPRPVDPAARTAPAEPMPVAAAIAVETPIVDAPPRRRPAWFVLSCVASVTVGAVLLWAVLGAPSHSSAKPLAEAASAAAAASAPVAAAPVEPIAPPVVAEPASPSASAPADPRHEPPHDPRHEPPRPSRSPEAAQTPPARAAATPARAPARAAASAPSVVYAPSRTPPSAIGAAPAPAAPCADMNVFSRAACLSRVCDAPQWSAHPQCVEMRRITEQRQRRMEQ